MRTLRQKTRSNGPDDRIALVVQVHRSKRTTRPRAPARPSSSPSCGARAAQHEAPSGSARGISWRLVERPRPRPRPARGPASRGRSRGSRSSQPSRGGKWCEQQHRERVRLLAGGAAGAPDAQRRGRAPPPRSLPRRDDAARSRNSNCRGSRKKWVSLVQMQSSIRTRSSRSSLVDERGSTRRRSSGRAPRSRASEPADEQRLLGVREEDPRLALDQRWNSANSRVRDRSRMRSPASRRARGCGEREPLGRASSRRRKGDGLRGGRASQASSGAPRSPTARRSTGRGRCRGSGTNSSAELAHAQQVVAR